MKSDNKENFSEGIKRILMFKSVRKIHDIINKEKQQKKSDKIHVLVIVAAAALAFLITLFVFSILKI